MDQKKVDEIDKKILSSYVIPITTSIFTTLLINLLLLSCSR